MKKLFSIILSTAILLNMAPAAFAAENPLADTLTAVTTKVKSQIAIPADFTKFNGNLEDNGYNEYWHLTWEKDTDSSLSIDASTTGKIMRYSNLSNSYVYNYDSSFAPAFPKFSRENAKDIASNFMKKIINTSNEGFVFLNNDTYYRPRNITNYDFNGNITLNGVQSPISFNIRVNIESKSVEYFSRDDMNLKYIGTVPSSKPNITKDAASNLLNGTVKLKLEYTTNTDEPKKDEKKGPKKAVLRYLPDFSGNYIVDAHSGKLIDMDALYKEIDTDPIKNAAAADATESMKADNKLTAAEQEGIDKINGVLPKEKMDTAIRAFNEFGLDGFTLNSAYYYITSENEYFCNLDYSKIESKDNVAYKYATINAKTAELISIYTNYSHDFISMDTTDKKVEKKHTIKFDKAETQKKAEEFLAKHYKDRFAKTKLYTTDNNLISRYDDFIDQYNFAQQENGFFFAENAYDVAVNKELGTIDRFSSNFTDVVFDSADGIVSMDKALSAFNGAFTTKLSYVNFPKKLDLSVPEYEPFIKRGYHYLYELKLAYSKDTEIWPYGVDAKTGKVLKYDNNKKDVLTYSDIKNDKEILALASYGIGFSGDKFEKSKKLTQRDMLNLLVSSNDGYIHKSEQTDELYQIAYNLGILKKSDRNDNKNITRAELIKTIISMSGYGKTAELSGIYVCSFKDHKDIPAKYYGYVAIAQGLGIIKSGANITFAPNTVATREQAAIILYNFMSR